MDSRKPPSSPQQRKQARWRQQPPHALSHALLKLSSFSHPWSFTAASPYSPRPGRADLSYAFVTPLPERLAGIGYVGHAARLRLVGWGVCVGVGLTWFGFGFRLDVEDGFVLKDGAAMVAAPAGSAPNRALLPAI